MNGANLSVFLSEVNGANPVCYLYFLAEKAIIIKLFSAL